MAPSPSGAVDVIVGPGNVYVATAKRLVAQEGAVGVPSAFAGPSEVVVVADETAPADYAALDLVVQAEHGPDGLAWLVSWSEEVAEAVEEAVDRFVAESPRRAEIEATLAKGGWSVLVDGPEQAMDVCNVVAPEHLELMTADPERCVPLVEGRAPCSAARGPGQRRRLRGRPQPRPADGPQARFSSALGTTTSEAGPRGVAWTRRPWPVAPHVAAIAEAEGLAAHAESVSHAGAGAVGMSPPVARGPTSACGRATTRPGRRRGAAQYQRVAVPAAAGVAGGSRRRAPRHRFNRYPDRGARALREALAELHGVGRRAGFLRQRLQRGAPVAVPGIRGPGPVGRPCSSRPTPCIPTSPI